MMSNPTLENIMIGEATFQKFSTELKTFGFIVSPEHGIDPTTGQITYVSVTADASVDWVAARGVFARLNAANILIGVGSNLRRHIWDGVNNGAIKLRDFELRRSR